MQTNTLTKLSYQAEASPINRGRPPAQQTISADSRRRLPLGKMPFSLSVLAALALVLGAGTAQAVTWGDGLTHTVNDATYQDEGIVLKNGTTLIIKPGAVLGGSEDFSGQLIAVSSTVIITDGTFGGAGYGSGQVFAYGTSTVTINGGTFGGEGGYSGAVDAQDTSTMTINGGTFGGAEYYSGAVLTYNASTVTINRGTFGGSGFASGGVDAWGSAAVTINGGTFGGTGNYSGSVQAYNTSTVTIQAASFDTADYNPDVGGTLGVTFCFQAPQSIEVLIDTGTGATVDLQTIVCDTDRDGVPDDQDYCGDSDLRETVWIGDCDSGVPNSIDEDGCTLADYLAEELSAAAQDARNHGQFVRTLAAYLNVLAAADAITEDEQDALMSCVGSSDESQFLP